MIKNILCHGLTFHKFNKWQIVDNKVEDINVGSIAHAGHSKKHWIKQQRVCANCGYTEIDIQVKWT